MLAEMSQRVSQPLHLMRLAHILENDPSAVRGEGNPARLLIDTDRSADVMTADDRGFFQKGMVPVYGFR
jgi:hypothetical protein